MTEQVIEQYPDGSTLRLINGRQRLVDPQGWIVPMTEFEKKVDAELAASMADAEKRRRKGWINQATDTPKVHPKVVEVFGWADEPLSVWEACRKAGVDKGAARATADRLIAAKLLRVAAADGGDDRYEIRHW